MAELVREWRLAANQPAIDRDHRAGYIVGQIGRQELHDLGAILDSSEPPKSHQLGSITVALNAAGDDCRHDPRGRNDAAGDAVDGDAEWPEIPAPNTAGNGR